jgi:hypothetical protein
VFCSIALFPVRSSLWLPHGHEHHSRVKKMHCFSSCALVVAYYLLRPHRRHGIFFDFFRLHPVLQCPMLFDGTNYCDWVPRMRLHMHGLRLWDFLTGEIPCPPRPSTPTAPVITERTTAVDKENLLADYDDRLASYESQFHAYKT